MQWIWMDLSLLNAMPEAAKARAKRPGISGHRHRLDDSCECIQSGSNPFIFQKVRKKFTQICVTVSVLPFSGIENTSSLETDQIEYRKTLQ